MIHSIIIALFKQTSELHVLVLMQGTKILIRYFTFYDLTFSPNYCQWNGMILRQVHAFYLSG
jgi:hypothetical protein